MELLDLILKVQVFRRIKAMLFKLKKCGNACISIGTGGVCASYGIGIKGFNI